AIGMVSFVAMIGAAVIMPIMMQDMLGFSAMKSGMSLMPGDIIMGLMSPITGRLFDKYGARWLAIIGLVITVITTFMFANLHVETSFTYLASVNAIRIFGIVMVMLLVINTCLRSLIIV